MADMSEPSRDELLSALRREFKWVSDRGQDASYADLTGWWRDPVILRGVGEALAGLVRSEGPTVVVGPESRGVLLGALTAAALEVGFVEVRKDHGPSAHSDAWLRRTSPPDYNDRHTVFGFPRRLLRSGDRVVMVDDWVATGATASTVRQLVEDSGANWLGVATVVDAAEDRTLRRRLQVSSLLHERQL